MDNPKPNLPTPKVSCVLQLAGDSVEFLVNGELAHVLPRASYEALQKGLAESEQLNLFPLEGTALKLRLPPVREVELGKVALAADEEGVYGRRYRIAEIKTTAGKSTVSIADAATGEVVEVQTWEDFAGHARAGRCRSATSYAAMLGEHNGRLYFSVMGDLYRPAGKAGAPAGSAAAPAAQPAADEEAPAALPPWRQWLRAHPRVGIAAAAVGLLILLLSGFFSGLISLSGDNRMTLDFRNVKSVEHFLVEYSDRAKYLAAIDFKDYAEKHPKVARDNIRQFREFIERADRADRSRWTEEQKARLQALKDALPKLQEQLR